MNAFKIIFDTRAGKVQMFELASSRDNAIMQATIRLVFQHHQYDDDFLCNLIGVNCVLIISKDGKHWI